MDCAVLFLLHLPQETPVNPLQCLRKAALVRAQAVGASSDLPESAERTQPNSNEYLRSRRHGIAHMRAQFSKQLPHNMKLVPLKVVNCESSTKHLTERLSKRPRVEIEEVDRLGSETTGRVCLFVFNDPFQIIYTN